MTVTLRSARVFPEKDFPIRVIRADRHGPTTLHTHEFNELVVIVSGRGRHLVGDGSYPIETGDVFVIRGEMQHGYADTEKMGLFNILFSPRRLKLPPADIGNIPGYHALFRIEPRMRMRDGFRSRFRLSVDQLAETERLIALLEDELAAHRSGYRYLATAHLMNLIGYVSRCCSRMQTFEQRPLMQMGRLLSFMEENYHEPLTVRRLTQVAGMSESSLMRSFRRLMNRSPMDYLIRLRISKACDMLQRGGTRITDVAYECGFNDSNYFSRQFRRVMGRSPREFRRGVPSA
jgi:AraC family L-rhamnose operon transcriptional activator RhaR/AraC family L-rhamnose operon regulatory protein RhaS